MGMIEKVIKRLEYCVENKCDICQEENGSGFPWIDGRCYGFTERLYDAIALLKAQEQITIEPKRIDLADETKAWLDKMDAVDALGNIADICMDWDGYRTADGLGGLVNEIWAYARYCADRLQKMQEPRIVTESDFNSADEYGYIPVWTEEKDGDMYWECIPKVAITDPDGIEVLRYWTSRPTDEQREAIPWKT